MYAAKRLAIVAAASLISATSGCGALGPSCLDRQQTGPVTSVTGNVAAQEVSTVVVPYDTRGSQNDVNISWAGQGRPGEPRIVMYATSADCAEFAPPTAVRPADDITGPCRIISRCGGSLSPDARPCAHAGTCNPTAEEIVCRSLIVTGPGNGAPPGFNQYKLHVVGDATRVVNYSIAISYFFGPDC